MTDVPYNAPTLLVAGLSVNEMDDRHPQRRHPMRVRLAAVHDDPTTDWGPNDLEGAACKGRFGDFDKLLGVTGKRLTSGRTGDRHLALDNVRRLCRGCPVRERCPDAEA